MDYNINLDVSDNIQYLYQFEPLESRLYKSPGAYFDIKLFKLPACTLVEFERYFVTGIGYTIGYIYDLHSF